MNGSMNQNNLATRGMILDKSVNILGTEYTITEDESLVNDDADGLTRVFKHQIFVRPYKKMLDADDSDNEKKACYRETIRHEIIHAFFKESGNEEYYIDEHLVQTLAVLYPKINTVLAEIGASA